MEAAAKRAVLRWIHLIVTIPLLGYIYSPPADMAPYGGGVRYIFAPVLILSGYWMDGGAMFAVLGVVLWLGAFQLAGFGAALLSQIALFIARQAWLTTGARRARKPANAPVLPR